MRSGTFPNLVPTMAPAAHTAGRARVFPVLDERPRAQVQLRIVVAIALVLRLALVFVPVDFGAPDTESYVAPARSLAAGQGYLDAAGRPTAERPPGFPAFLALVFVVAGPSPRAVGVAHAVLGAATVYLVHRLLRRRWPSAALPAAAVLAVDPIALGLVPFVLREALLLFTLTLLLVLLEELRERPIALALAGGAALATLALTHQLYVLLGPFLVVAAVVAKDRRRALALLLAMAVVVGGLAAWGARNRAIGSRNVALTSYPVPAGELWLVSESTDWWLHDDPSTGFQDLHFREIGRLYDEHGGDVDLVKRDLYARALENFRREPLRVIGRAVRMNIWYWLEVPGSIRITHHPRLCWLRVGLVPFQWLRLFWAIVAVFFIARRSFAMELGAWAFLALAPALLLPIPRYLAPLSPVLDALAVVGFLAHRQGALTSLRNPTTPVVTPDHRSSPASTGGPGNQPAGPSTEVER